MRVRWTDDAVCVSMTGAKQEGEFKKKNSARTTKTSAVLLSPPAFVSRTVVLSERAEDL